MKITLFTLLAISMIGLSGCGHFYHKCKGGESCSMKKTCGNEQCSKCQKGESCPLTSEQPATEKK